MKDKPVPKLDEPPKEDDLLRRMLSTPAKPKRKRLPVPEHLFEMPFNAQFVREAEYVARKALATVGVDPELDRLKAAAAEAQAAALESTRTTSDATMTPGLTAKATRAWHKLLQYIDQRP
jgi:hypothetical protein